MNDPDREREQEIKRAVEAIQGAPRTESGIIIPPHVAAAPPAAPEEAPPNRAQRRRNEKAARKQAKRLARLNAKLAAESGRARGTPWSKEAPALHEDADNAA